jgi:hypothetical protein
MKYRVLKISPSLNRSAWELESCYVDPMDREDVKTVPSPNGFYHSPIAESEDVAIEKLIATMIQSHEEEIRKLSESVAKLVDFRLTLIGR